MNIIDILPTVCDLLEADIPFAVQGKNLLPILKGEGVPSGEFDVAGGTRNT